MKVAIDKSIVNQIKDFDKFDYIYVFEDEPLDELIKLKYHCIHKDYVDRVDVNLTKYNINARITTTIEDESWKDFKKPNYKYAIIIPSYNNDHRRL